MSERTQTTIAQDFDAMMRDAEEAQKYAAWIKQFNTLCKDLYIDLNDQESVNRIFIVPDNAVRQNANTELDFMKHAYALSAKTDEEYTAAQRAAEIFAGRQNGCDVYVAAPGSYGYRKVNFGENLKPSLSEEIYAPGEKELVAPTKPGRWMRFANWLTRGSAYKDAFETYESEQKAYTEALAEQMEKVEAYAKIDALNDHGVGRDMEKENRYKQRIDHERSLASARSLVEQHERSFTNGKNNYQALFAPTVGDVKDTPKLDEIQAATYTIPTGMSIMQARAIAFSATLTYEALSKAGHDTSSIPDSAQRSREENDIINRRIKVFENYLPKDSERKGRQAGLSNAVIHGRQMMASLTEEAEKGNYAPMAKVWHDAVTSIIGNRAQTTSMDRTNIGTLAPILQDLKSCLQIPGMQKAVKALGFSKEDEQRINMVIGSGEILNMQVNSEKSLVVNEFDLRDTAQKEAQDSQLQNLIATKMLEIEYQKQAEASREAAHGQINKDFADKKITAAEHADLILSTLRPLTEIEKGLAKDPDLVMHSFVEKAIQSQVYQAMQKCSGNEIHKMIRDLSMGNLNRQLEREPISERELSGKKPEQISRNRNAQPVMTSELTNSK